MDTYTYNFHFLVLQQARFGGTIKSSKGDQISNAQSDKRLNSLNTHLVAGMLSLRSSLKWKTTAPGLSGPI